MDHRLAHEMQWAAHQGTDGRHDRMPGEVEVTCVSSMYACVLCRSGYEHSWGAQQENEATYVLAQKLSSLSRVYWLDLWDISQPSHSWGLRATSIIRSNDTIRLLRDDGLVESWRFW
jgi:hypothetical protein